jgi:hypothetical protein
MENEFTCSICGETFDKGLSEEDAEKQFAIEFPLDYAAGIRPADCDLVCDDCFHAMFPEMQEKKA